MNKFGFELNIEFPYGLMQGQICKPLALEDSQKGGQCMWEKLVDFKTNLFKGYLDAKVNKASRSMTSC